MYSYFGVSQVSDFPWKAGKSQKTLTSSKRQRVSKTLQIW